MVEQFRSAGVTTREIEQQNIVAQQSNAIPACVISTTEKGPAFLPTILTSPEEYETTFGVSTTDNPYGFLSANEWLSYQPSLMQVKILGVGDGTKRTSTGTNKGKVTNAGFVVGDQQPQSSLSGGLTNNPYAVPTSAGAIAATGRNYVLAVAMSQSVGSTVFTDAGLSETPIILRGMIMAASGVVLTLSASNASNDMSDNTLAADLTVGINIKGFHTGSVNLRDGSQNFIMLLNGHRGSTNYPRVLTGSFDHTRNNYFGNIFNKDPLKLEEAGHLLYSYFDINTAVATVTGSGIVPAVSGAGTATGAGYERIAFLVTTSLGRNAGSATVPNFEGFEDRFRTANSSWIISQKFGGTPINLFKFWSLDDGEIGHKKVKITIENITPSNNTSYLFGTFDVVVRDINDNDTNKIVLEPFRGLSLDPKNARFIGKIIGNGYTYFNFDASESKQKLVDLEGYPVRSKYIRVELSDEVLDESIDPSALPMGFRGPQHLVTSGSSIFNAHSDDYLTITNPLRRIVQLPVPMRINLVKGTGSSQTVDRNLCWGVQFEQRISATEPNSTIRPNTSLESFRKFYPNYHTEYMNVVVRDNEGVTDTAENTILDSDRFNNNIFTLENVQITYNATSLLPDLNTLTSWSYIRQGGITTNTGALTRALTVTDLRDTGVRALGKFSFYLEGGFDGVRIFNRETKKLSNIAAVEEYTNSTRGLTQGSTIKAYQKALDIIADTSYLDFQIITIPGMRLSYLTDLTQNLMETSKDAMFIMDIEERDSGNQKVLSETQVVNVLNTITDFQNRGISTSYTSAYFPDANVLNRSSRTRVRVPPSVVVLGIFAKNDSIGHPWTAPAGYTRGNLSSTESLTTILSRKNMNDLASANINPLVVFPGQGPVVWGQKTLNDKMSAFDRINVRRLLLDLRRKVRTVAQRMLFEPARDTTLARFSALVNPILKRIQDLKGVEQYKVIIDTSTTTEADIENKTIRGLILLVPTKALEFVSLDFVVTNTGVNV